MVGWERTSRPVSPKKSISKSCLVVSQRSGFPYSLPVLIFPDLKAVSFPYRIHCA